MADESKNCPKHVAIIMDGNGRWAEKRSISKGEAHKQGGEVLKIVAKFLAQSTSVEYLTVFAFAQANNKRELAEKKTLASLLVDYTKQVTEFLEYDCRVRFVGNFETADVNKVVRSAMRRLESKTAHCRKFHLQIAWNYSGEDEIRRAQRAGWDITRLYHSMFDAPGVPAINLLFRTGVDNPVGLNWRDSDFFSLLSAKAVKIPFSIYWPDFTTKHVQTGITNWKAEKHLDGGSRTL